MASHRSSGVSLPAPSLWCVEPIDPALLPEDEFADPERLRRRARLRLIAVVVVIAMIAAIVVPVIVRRITRDQPPDTVVTLAA